MDEKPVKKPRKKAAPKLEVVPDPVEIPRDDAPYDLAGDVAAKLRESGWGPDAVVLHGQVHTAMGETTPLLSVEACAAIGIHTDDPVVLWPLPAGPGLPQATV